VWYPVDTSTPSLSTATSAVCVIIAAYNCQETIIRAIASALAEPEATEVVVVDDASTDDTVATAHSADDGSGRLRILTQLQNAGPSAARNRAIQESQAPWIAILDSDDFFMPGRLKGLLAFAQQADLIADDLWQVPEDNVTGPRRSLLGTSLLAPQSITFAEFVMSNVTRADRQRGELGFIKPLIRRQFLTEYRITYQEQMRLGEDYELYARALAMGGRLLLVPAQGYVSVIRLHSLSGRHSETDLLHLRDCDHALMKIEHLSPVDKQAIRQHYLSIDCRLQWRLLIIAIKNRKMGDIISTFLRPFPVPWYLVKQLALEVYIRSFPKKPSNISINS